MNIIVVEDVVDLRDEIVHWLGRDGHEVHGAGNSMEMDRLLDRVRPQLVILDIGLPGEDGLALCSRLQEVPELHIAILSARGTDEDRRRGLVAGADSYLVKPVDFCELDAVIRRLELRRRLAVDNTAGGWILRTQQQLMMSPGGRRVVLTYAETRLLRVLVQKVGRTATRAELMKALGLSNVPDDRRIEVSLSRLRAKIKAGCGVDLPVKANRAVGYSFLEECRLVE